MNFQAEIRIMPKQGLLDPQGRTLSKNLKRIGLKNMHDVRVGKHIQVRVAAASREQALQMIKNACDKLFVNSVAETCSYEITEINSQ